MRSAMVARRKRLSSRHAVVADPAVCALVAHTARINWRSRGNGTCRLAEWHINNFPEFDGLGYRQARSEANKRLFPGRSVRREKQSDGSSTKLRELRYPVLICPAHV